MNGSGGIRGVAASVVGWLVAIIVVVIAFRFLLGTLGFLFRSFFVVVLVVALLWLYFRLKSDPDPDPD